MTTTTISEASFGDSDVFDDLASLSFAATSEEVIHRLASTGPASPSNRETHNLTPNPRGRFFFEDGTVTFLVEGATYRIHRYFLSRDSPYFRQLFKGIDFFKPIELKDTTTAEFDAFLSILYPLDFQCCEITTVTGWTSVLRLATRWGFTSIRALAIERLEPLAFPVDKIALSHAFDVPQWLMPSYTSLCARDAPPTREECSRLQMDDVVLVFRVREAVFRSGTFDDMDEVSRRVAEEMIGPSKCDPCMETSPQGPAVIPPPDAPSEPEDLCPASSMLHPKEATPPNAVEELLEGVTEENVDAVSARVVSWASKPSQARAGYTLRDLVYAILRVCARSQSPSSVTIARHLLSGLLDGVAPDAQDADLKFKGRELIATHLAAATLSRYLHTMSGIGIIPISEVEKIGAQQATMIIAELLKAGVVPKAIAYNAVNNLLASSREHSDALAGMCGLLRIMWPIMDVSSFRTWIWRTDLELRSKETGIDAHTQALVQDLLSLQKKNWVT